jgi:acetolactate synthase-1/2/3 large subunit
MKASDLLVRCLEGEGITHVFGVPGEENAELMLSLEGSSIEFVLTRHEQGAAFMAKGCVDRDAPYCLFTIGLQQKDFPALAIEQSDLVLALGYDLVEYPPRLWNADGRKTIVHLDFDPAEIDAQYHPTIEVIGDLAHALWMLNERVRRDGVPSFDLGYQREVRERMIADFREHADDDAVGSLKPQKILWDVRQALGPDDLVLSGVGAHKMWVGRYFHCHEPNTCIIALFEPSRGPARPEPLGVSPVSTSRGPHRPLGADRNRSENGLPMKKTAAPLCS